MPDPVRPVVFLFDWGDTLMCDDPAQAGPMANWPQVEAMPGAVETLAWAQSQGRVGIASGAADSDAGQIRAALTRVVLDRYVDFIFCQRELGFGKTDPRFWQHILTTLQIPPEQVVMIGDSHAADVVAPQAAGLHAVWFNWRDEPPRNSPTIVRLEELPRLLAGNLVES